MGQRDCQKGQLRIYARARGSWEGHSQGPGPWHQGNLPRPLQEGRSAQPWPNG